MASQNENENGVTMTVTLNRMKQSPESVTRPEFTPENEVLPAMPEAVTAGALQVSRIPNAKVRVSFLGKVCSRERETKSVSLSKIVELIRSNKDLRTRILAIRKIYNEALASGGQDAAKEAIAKAKEKLPAVLLSGTFKNAKKPVAEKLTRHSGLLCADLDHLGDTLNDVRVKLLDSRHLLTVFLSPSGDGLKAAFRVPADAARHAASWRAVREHVLELTGVEIDEKCKDVGRPCFLSHDPDVSVNDAAVELAVEESESSQSESDEPEPASAVIAHLTDAEIQRRQRIAVEIVGDLDWETKTCGFGRCPNESKHSKKRDRLKVNIDGVPTIFCFHDGCKDTIQKLNGKLRSRIGRAPNESATAGEALTGSTWFIDHAYWRKVGGK